MSYNVAHHLAEQAQQNTQLPAVRAAQGRSADGSIHYQERTFGELESEAAATAHLFCGQGLVRGTRVLLMVKPGLDLIRVVFALFKIGAVPIVIDPGMGLKGFLNCVRHSRPQALIGIPSAIWVARIFRPSFRGVTLKLCVDKRFTRRLAHFAEKGRFPVVESRIDELAAILFTSGSTGPAKGVCYTHGMFTAQVHAIQTQYNICAGEMDLPMLPVFALFNPALGMCTVVPEMNPSRPASVDPEKIVRAIQQNQITNSFGSPALWSKIARYCTANEVTLPSIRRILMAGAPVPPALMEQMVPIIPNGEIHTPYGATEALPVSSIDASEILSNTSGRTCEGAGTCVGQPLPEVRVAIVEPVDGVIDTIAAAHLLPCGEVGEIIVNGPSVTRCYDNLPRVDAESKISDGEQCWHRMGDMGWLDEEGRLWFCGRKAERVLTADGPMYTDCCEAIFNQHPKVFRSALIQVSEGVPAIVIEPESGAYPTTDTMIEQLSQELRKLALNNNKTASIRHFYFEKAFPVDVRHNAKIHRLSLARKFAEKKRP